MRRLFSLLSLLILTGCSALPMKHDGIYVIEDVSTKGKTRTAYHFVDNDYMHSLRNVKLSNEGLLSWYQTEINDDLVKYSLLFPTQISWSSNKNGFHQHGKIARNFGGGVKGSSFYKVKDGRIESITPQSSEDREAKSYEIYNDHGELQFKGLYKNLSEISAGYYLVQNEKGYQILNREGKAVSDTYTWIGSRSQSAPRYLMAYDGTNFCVLTPTGQTKIPCKHQDMMELEDYQYAISNGNTQILIDSNGNELFRTPLENRLLTSNPSAASSAYLRPIRDCFHFFAEIRKVLRYEEQSSWICFKYDRSVDGVFSGRLFGIGHARKARTTDFSSQRRFQKWIPDCHRQPEPNCTIPS